MKSNLTVQVFIQPDNKTQEVVGAKTVAQLLSRLDIPSSTAMVIRDSTPLTHDLHLKHGDNILIRRVMSLG